MLFLYCYCDFRRGRCGFRRRLHEGDLSIHSRSNYNNDSQQTEQAQDRAKREWKIRSEWVEKSLVTTTFAAVFDDSTHTMGTFSSGSVSTSSTTSPIILPAQSAANKHSYGRERPEQKNNHESTNIIFHLPNFLSSHNSNESSNTNNEIENEVSLPLSSSCAICLEHYRRNDKISYSKHQKCSHVFHTACIVSWLTDQKRDDCPYCRGKYIQKIGGDKNGQNDDSENRSFALVRRNNTVPRDSDITETEHAEGSSRNDVENGLDENNGNNSQNENAEDDTEYDIENGGIITSQTAETPMNGDENTSQRIGVVNENNVIIDNAEEDLVNDVENDLNGEMMTSQTAETYNNDNNDVKNETAAVDGRETRVKNSDE